MNDNDAVKKRIEDDTIMHRRIAEISNFPMNNWGEIDSFNTFLNMVIEIGDNSVFEEIGYDIETVKGMMIRQNSYTGVLTEDDRAHLFITD